MNSRTAFGQFPGADLHCFFQHKEKWGRGEEANRCIGGRKARSMRDGPRALEVQFPRLLSPSFFPFFLPSFLQQMLLFNFLQQSLPHAQTLPGTKEMLTNR